jgi:hypothetical protein
MLDITLNNGNVAETLLQVPKVEVTLTRCH